MVTPGGVGEGVLSCGYTWWGGVGEGVDVLSCGYTWWGGGGGRRT